jgi:hypothetical protein
LKLTSSAIVTWQPRRLGVTGFRVVVTHGEYDLLESMGSNTLCRRKWRADCPELMAVLSGEGLGLSSKGAQRKLVLQAHRVNDFLH